MTRVVIVSAMTGPFFRPPLFFVLRVHMVYRYLSVRSLAYPLVCFLLSRVAFFAWPYAIPFRLFRAVTYR